MRDIPIPVSLEPTKLIPRYRLFIRSQNKAYRTEQTYVFWVKRFIHFYNNTHPDQLNAEHVNSFLTYLVIEGNAAKNTQRTALNALVHFYDKFLKRPLKGLTFESAKKQRRIPEVFTYQKAKSVICRVREPYYLMTDLMYRSGLRLMEAVRLRVQDVELGYQQIIIRNEKDNKERVVPLPLKIANSMRQYITDIKRQYEVDIQDGFGSVYMLA
jgi:site-specific recombinase XerD